MKILIHDKMFMAENVPEEIITPALSDIYEDSNTFTVNFLTNEKINCVGIGNTDATVVTIENSDGDIRTITITQSAPYQNGLYLINTIYPGDDEYGGIIKISHNGTYIGRVGIGEYRTLGTGITKEIGFYTTTETRKTLQGQIIPGAGGYCGRTIDVDVRYKIDSEIYEDIAKAYPSQIQKQIPFFLLFDDEQHKVPSTMLRMYAHTKKPIDKLQSDIYRFKYSYKFEFIEAF